MIPQPLRVGLLIDSWRVPQWVHKVVSEIQSSEIAQVVLVVKNAEPPEPSRSFFKKIWCYRKELFYLLYKKIDETTNRVHPDAFERKQIEPLVASCPVIQVKPVKKKYYDYFQEGDLARIFSYDLDVALRFGFNILMGKALQIAKYGVWSYHHGDPSAIRGGPAGFWEVMEKRPVTGSVLQILTPELDQGKILYRSYAATDPFSMKKNRNNYYWKSSAFILRKLKDLAEKGPEGLNHILVDGDDRPHSSRIYKTPRNSEMISLMGKWIARYGAYQIRNLLFQEQWFIAFHLEVGGAGPDEALAFDRFTPLLPPKDRFWADPFPVRKGNQYFIFIEEYLTERRKGHISVIEIDSDGRWKKPVEVLESDDHLSYPFVFEWGGDYYMIPETSSRRTLELYRCSNFPHEWTLEKVLMTQVNAVDTTLAQVENRWWLFANMAQVEGHVKNWDELYLFYADHPLGPWEPHARNPVKSDVRSSRPAGRLFSRNGHWYRPSQDCSQRYGGAICINQIQVITPTEYREKETARILPEWRRDLIANHTLNSVEGMTVIDGLLRRRR